MSKKIKVRENYLSETQRLSTLRHAVALDERQSKEWREKAGTLIQELVAHLHTANAPS